MSFEEPWFPTPEELHEIATLPGKAGQKAKELLNFEHKAITVAQVVKAKSAVVQPKTSEWS